MIDLSVGLYLQKKVGDYVKKGDVIATFYASDQDKLLSATERFGHAVHIGSEAVAKTDIIKGIIRA